MILRLTCAVAERGSNLEDPIEVGQSSIQSSLPVQRQTPSVIGSRERRVDLNRSAGVGDCVIQPALADSYHGTIPVGLRKLAIQFDCPVVVSYRLLDLALGLPEVASVVMGRSQDIPRRRFHRLEGRLTLLFDCGRVIAESSLPVAGLVTIDAPIVVGLSKVRPQ